MSKLLSEANKKQLTNELASNLPVFRAKLNISQQELADRIGISRNMLTYIEGKKREMSWVTFVALCLLFMKNDQTKYIFKSLNIYTKELDDYLMFNNNV